MFSPYYAWARRRGPQAAARHCALNVALYGRTKRWAMTERGSATATAETLAIGPSRMEWDGTALRIMVDERAVPQMTRVRGVVTVWPAALTRRAFPIDGAGRHVWAPIAPSCRVEVDLPWPGLRWAGTGYLDHNAGTAPLERDFLGWHWSRAATGRETLILYETEAVAGRDADASLALRVDAAGAVEPFAPPPRARLRPGFWGVARATRSEDGARVRETLTDAPFYTRSVIETRLLGRDVLAMHESLSLRRFRHPVVRAMLAFRMPRVG